MKPSSLPALTRAIIAYALLVAGLPVLQGASFITGGWTESVALLALYFFVPLGGVWLATHRSMRPGAIILLGFMSSGFVINSMLFANLRPPLFASPVWFVVLRVWILALIVVQVITAWLAFRVLQEAHRLTLPPGDPTA